MTPEKDQIITEMIRESLRDWFKKEDWVRIDTQGNISGKCGTMKNKKVPSRPFIGSSKKEILNSFDAFRKDIRKNFRK